ncbi:MAG: DNA mismatch repair protein MutS [Candidatus Borkfalkiaceae bacterium]|nr:DNA mismatch repair protein MutS [Christensenellaceae bacterium]
MAAKGKLSPMMVHYNKIKEKYPDCVVFYRLGDFYEMFFDDAIRVSKMLDLTLTGRDCGLDEKAPMCGIPYHAADEYISKLVEQGEKVAICEQLEDPSLAKGLVERDVIKIVTAGTVTEESLIDEKENNFIACAYYGEKGSALSWCDITTGEFFARKCESADVLNELSDNLTRINPSEIICNEKLAAISDDLPVVKHRVIPRLRRYSDDNFLFRNAQISLKDQFGVISFKAFGIEENDEPLISASGALIAYLKETQKRTLININGIKLEKNADIMGLDYSALRNLELVKSMAEGKRYGTLLWVLDKTQTPMGARMLGSWVKTPLQDIDKINYRLDGVEELFKNPLLRSGVTEQLKFIRDTERIAGKISNGNINPKDCLTLGESLSALPNVKLQLFGVSSKILNDVNDNIGDFGELASLLRNAIDPSASSITKDGGYIKKGFDSELDRLRSIKDNSANLLREMEAKEREATGIKTLKINFNRVFGYYIEVTNSFKNLVPYNYVRKQTLAGAERYITEDLKKLETDILSSNEQSIRIEADIFAKIKQVLGENVKKIQRTSKSVACLDALASLATVAKRNGYNRPEIVKSDEPMDIVGGRHPVVEAVSNEPFVSNDTYLDCDENRVLIITGPNMAGKSTYMRQNALIAVMAHMGSFVPCKSAKIPIIDRIFTRVGASDNLIFNQSTFMVEMTEVASILINATSRSLLILDEVGRGTSTYDGLSIAWAVVEFLAEKTKAKTLFATHYHELSELEGIIDGVKNYKITVREQNGKIVFLRKIARGSANRSFGIEVASLAGVPKTVTDRAKTILRQLEKNDLAKRPQSSVPDDTDSVLPEEFTAEPSEVEKIIAETNINDITPLDALKLLFDLKNKLNG